MRIRRRKYYNDFDYKPRKTNWKKVCGVVFGFLFAAMCVNLWVALFSGAKIEGIFVYLPVSTLLCFVSFHFYMRELSYLDVVGWFVVALYILNAVVSIAGWFSNDSDVSFISICHIIILALLVRLLPK